MPTSGVLERGQNKILDLGIALCRFFKEIGLDEIERWGSVHREGMGTCNNYENNKTLQTENMQTA